MNKTVILPADTYFVINKTVMNDTDRLILTMLYQPLIGYKALSLYFSLWADLDNAELMSIEFTHRHLMNMTHLKLEEIVEERRKLEAIGLLKTSFMKMDSINNYVYQLYAPLSAAEVLTHPFLSVILRNNLGTREFERVVEYFKLPKMDLSQYNDISAAFSDIFQTGTALFKESQEDLRKRQSLDLDFKVDLDFDLIKSTLPKDMVNAKAFDKSTCKLIKELCYLYNIDNMHVASIISHCLDERGLIDKAKLQSNARNYYKFEHNDELPYLIYNNKPVNARTELKDNSMHAKLIYKFETLSPYEFLKERYGGAEPVQGDKKLIETLLIEQELKPWVINVLIDYVLKINDSKLSKNFVEKIAGQWKILDINTVEGAMKQAEKEYKTKKTPYVKNNTTTISEKVPEWFDKEIGEEQLSDEEQEKMKALLSEFS